MASCKNKKRQLWLENNLRAPEPTEETNETQISEKQESSLLQRGLAIYWVNT